MKHIDILIIGGCLSGLMIAEHYATIGKKVLIIEKKDNIEKDGPCADSEVLDFNSGFLKNRYLLQLHQLLCHDFVEILFGTDYVAVKDSYTGYEKLYYIGSVEHFFAFTQGFGEQLEYRSITFINETHDADFLREHYHATAIDFAAHARH